jgi:hypothetical protein
VDKKRAKAAAQVLSALADSLWNECARDEWLPVWRLVNTIDVPPADQLRQLEPLLPGINNAYPQAIKNKLIDAAIGLLVSQGRAEQRVDCEVEDVRFVGSKPRWRNN